MKRSITLGVCVCALTALASAQTESKAGFKTGLSLGMTLTDGNSETLQANATLLTEGEKDRLGSVRAGAEANYGRSTVDETEETTVENARLFANARKTLSPRTFVSLDGSVLYDDIALVDYRVTVGPGLGVYLIKTDRTDLSLEAGPSYVWERVAEQEDDYLALRVSERFSHTLGAGAKVWQSLDYLPKADDFDDYLLKAEIGIEAPVNTRVNLRLVLRDVYDSTPAADLEKNDLTLIAGFTLAL